MRRAAEAWLPGNPCQRSRTCCDCRPWVSGIGQSSPAANWSVSEAVSLIDVKVSPGSRSEYIIQRTDIGNLAQGVHVANDTVAGAQLSLDFVLYRESLFTSVNRVAMPCSPCMRRPFLRLSWTVWAPFQSDSSVMGGLALRPTPDLRILSASG